MNARTEFWRGDFGNEYQQRSPGDVRANYNFFQRALRLVLMMRGPASVCELGAGTGANLRALRSLVPSSDMAAVEVNDVAVQHLPEDVEVFHQSLLDWMPPRQWELAFTKGVLIHVAPEDLPNAYEALWAASSRFILVAEYYNPVPTGIDYRGHEGRLWKRDFASDMVKRFNLEVIDYGFAWHADPHMKQDDLTWFLMEKR
jgi:pseudaminic acid biosynthesis-associated methylase